jgi:hypothetical protein
VNPVGFKKVGMIIPIMPVKKSPLHFLFIHGIGKPRQIFAFSLQPSQLDRRGTGRFMKDIVK